MRHKTNAVRETHWFSNSFLYYHLHIKVVHPCKFKQNLSYGLTDGQVQRYKIDLNNQILILFKALTEANVI